MEENKYIIDAVWTATRIIEAVALNKEPMSTAEISRALEITANMAFRQCVTLSQAGILEACGDQKYKLGMKMAIFWAKRKAHVQGDIDRATRELSELEEGA